MEEPVEERERGSVGKTGEEDSPGGESIATADPRKDLEEPAIVDLAPGVSASGRRDEQMAEALRLASPRPEEVRAVARPSVESDDERPFAVGRIVL
ncbi:MAG: hypothetical protein ACREQY_23485, partial [Candidatus Binatia bacterium]